MSYIKLFLLFVLAIIPYNFVYCADSDVNNVVVNKSKNSTSKKDTKGNNKKIKKIIRKSVKKQATEKIRQSNVAGSATTTSYQLSNKTINLKSPMCKYAKNNDVIALKKALLSSNYSQSEVNTVCENGESLFMIAVKNDNFLTAKFLIEKGADINLPNEAGATPLHIIARSDSQNINRIFDLLIYRQDLNVNIKDNEGYTAIMRAVDFENLFFIKQIMQLNINLNVKNAYGKTVFDLAYKILDGKKTEQEKQEINKIIDFLNKK